MPFCLAAGVNVTTLQRIEVHGYVPGEELRARLASYLRVLESDIWPHLGTRRRRRAKAVSSDQPRVSCHLANSADLC
jgi:hypothetical protein